MHMNTTSAHQVVRPSDDEVRVRAGRAADTAHAEVAVCIRIIALQAMLSLRTGRGAII